MVEAIYWAVPAGVTMSALAVNLNATCKDYSVVRLVASYFMGAWFAVCVVMVAVSLGAG
jgi:hypothetical protein